MSTTGAVIALDDLEAAPSALHEPRERGRPPACSRRRAPPARSCARARHEQPVQRRPPGPLREALGHERRLPACLASRRTGAATPAVSTAAFRLGYSLKCTIGLPAALRPGRVASRPQLVSRGRWRSHRPWPPFAHRRGHHTRSARRLAWLLAPEAVDRGHSQHHQDQASVRIQLLPSTSPTARPLAALSRSHRSVRDRGGRDEGAPLARRLRRNG